MEEGYNLDDAEVKAAIKILDKDGDGLINFPEFVDWWVNKVKLPLLPLASAGVLDPTPDNALVANKVSCVRPEGRGSEG